MAVQMTKSQLIEKIAVESEVAKKDVKGFMATLATIGYSELKKNGVFLVPALPSSSSSRRPPPRRAKVPTLSTANK